MKRIALFALLAAACSTFRGGREVEVVATDYAYSPDRIFARPGERIEIMLVNRGSHPHGITFVLPGGDETLDEVRPADSDSVSFSAPDRAGTYDFYCPVNGHADRGMRGVIVVEEAGRP